MPKVPARKMNQFKKLVDEMGEIKAQIAELNQRQSEIKELLSESGEEKIEGKLFCVKITHFTRKSVDTKQLYEDYGFDDDVLSEYTTEDDQTRLTISHR